MPKGRGREGGREATHSHLKAIEKCPRREREGILTESPRRELVGRKSLADGGRSKRDRANWDTKEERERERDEPTKRELFGQLKKGAVVTCSWTVPECTAGQRHKMGWTVSVRAQNAADGSSN